MFLPLTNGTTSADLHSTLTKAGDVLELLPNSFVCLQTSISQRMRVFRTVFTLVDQIYVPRVRSDEQ